ncbi:unnamed protein product [Mytilus edulis]|uniref:Ig-like domain-containing protein n=1 Tax=Mytilus edulis TaxID=6550 RepID=A0A8S3UHU3_MYTED|nr:unnamed protein product [Mytilus edulis]
MLACSCHYTPYNEVPTVHVDPGPHRVEYGHDITLVCNLTYSPFFYNASWTQVQTGLITEYRTNVSQILFKISDATYEDSGQYTCNAASQYGSRQSQPVNISVYGEFPVREIYWQFNNNGVITKIVKDTNGISGSSIETPSLTILEMTTSESGIYNCFARNDIGTGQSKPINVAVTGGVPIVNVRDTIYSIGYGEKATLNCFITSNPSVTNVYWEKEVNGTKNILNNLTMGIQGVSRNDPSLVLMESTKSDIGTYRCVAINDVGTGKSETLSLMVVGDSDSGLYRCFAVNVVGMGYSSSVNLDVIGGVPEVSVPSITHLTGTGYTVTLICKVTNAFPEVFRVYWQRYLHGSITVISSASIGIKGVTVESPSLIIPSAMESMTGNIHVSLLIL